MQITKLEKEDQPLFSRVEYKGEIKFDKATPSNADVRNAISQKEGTPVEMIIVKNITVHYGQHVGEIVALAYTDKEKMKQLEDVKEEEKPAEEAKEEAPAAEEKPAEEAKPEEKKEEAPAEEPKAEEKPAEEKKE